MVAKFGYHINTSTGNVLKILNTILNLFFCPVTSRTSIFVSYTSWTDFLYYSLIVCQSGWRRSQTTTPDSRILRPESNLKHPAMANTIIYLDMLHITHIIACIIVTQSGGVAGYFQGNQFSSLICRFMQQGTPNLIRSSVTIEGTCSVSMMFQLFFSHKNVSTNTDTPMTT